MRPGPHGSESQILVAVGDRFHPFKTDAPPPWEDPEVTALKDEVLFLGIKDQLADGQTKGSESVVATACWQRDCVRFC